MKKAKIFKLRNLWGVICPFPHPRGVGKFTSWYHTHAEAIAHLQRERHPYV